jgi:hypothetical protein
MMASDPAMNNNESPKHNDLNFIKGNRKLCGKKSMPLKSGTKNIAVAALR